MSLRLSRDPVPVTPGTGVLQVELLYRVKATDVLVGGAVVPASVAMASRLEMSTPAVPEVGLACTVTEPDAAACVIGATTKNATATSQADHAAKARRERETRPGRFRCPLTFPCLPWPYSPGQLLCSQSNWSASANPLSSSEPSRSEPANNALRGHGIASGGIDFGISASRCPIHPNAEAPTAEGDFSAVGVRRSLGRCRL